MSNTTPELKRGAKISKNFELVYKIETLDELYIVLKTERSIFARHRPYPSAFVLRLNFHTIVEWLERGWFWTIRKQKHPVKAEVGDTIVWLNPETIPPARLRGYKEAEVVCINEEEEHYCVYTEYGQDHIGFEHVKFILKNKNKEQ